jgi:hypothetical protein
LRLIVESSKSDLDALAREAKALEDRKKAITLEEARLSKKVQNEAERESPTEMPSQYKLRRTSSHLTLATSAPGGRRHRHAGQGAVIHV